MAASTQSPNNYRIALLAAYAIALHGMETLLPSPVPWLRLGLANIITLITLCLYGMKPALMVTVVRVTVSSLLTGTFPGPAFLLSLGGGLAAVLSMGGVLLIAPRIFSPLGLSVIGAFFHNVTQLALAYLVIIQRLEAILLVAPLVILFGTLAGVVNGVISLTVLQAVKQKTGHATIETT